MKAILAMWSLAARLKKWTDLAELFCSARLSLHFPNFMQLVFLGFFVVNLLA
jgi:hypothetical protein